MWYNINMRLKFKIRQSLHHAWDVYRENFGALFLLTLLTLGSSILFSSIAFFLVSIVFNAFICYIWINYLTHIVDGREINLFSSKILPDWNSFFSFFKTSLLVGIYIILGFILLILPGFYIMARLMPALYVSYEENKGARYSIRKSWQMTRGNSLVILWKSLVLGVFGTIGFVLFFVGGLITYPLSMISFVMLYNEIKKLNSHEEKNLN